MKLAILSLMISFSCLAKNPELKSKKQQAKAPVVHWLDGLRTKLQSGQGKIGLRI